MPPSPCRLPLPQKAVFLSYDQYWKVSGRRMLAVDAAVMRVWGNLTSRLEASGEMMGLMDSLIAATAVYHGLTVTTRNEEDFRRVPVNVLNPWRLYRDIVK